MQHWIWSNLQHECQTRATPVRDKCNMSAAQMTRLRRKCYTNDTSATRVKNFDFDNDTSKTFSHPYIYYMVSERLQREE